VEFLLGKYSFPLRVEENFIALEEDLIEWTPNFGLILLATNDG